MRTVEPPDLPVGDRESGSVPEAERALQELAQVFLQQSFAHDGRSEPMQSQSPTTDPEAPLVNMETRYRALVEQIPAVVFMAYLDRGIGEAYVSPQIEAALGFSQSEW